MEKNWLQSHAAVQPLSWFAQLGKDLADRRGTESHVLAHLSELGIAQDSERGRAALREFRIGSK